MNKINLKKRVTTKAIVLTFIGLYFLAFQLNNKPNQKNDFYENYEEEESEEEIAYEREIAKNAFPLETELIPKNLTGVALKKYTNFLQNIDESNNTFTSKTEFYSYTQQAYKNKNQPKKTQEYTYANSSLVGTWSQKYLHLNSTTKPGYKEGGFRAVGSTYDPINNEVYVISSPGHLYKINENAAIKWSLRNHKKNLKGDDFNGVNLADGSFRLLHQKGNGGMEFSDDEGRTWVDANGAFYENFWNYKTVVTKRNNCKRIVAHGARNILSDSTKYKAYHRIYISNDYGLNYTTSNSLKNYKVNEYDAQICKPHNSKTVYCFVRRKRDAKLFIYRMRENDDDFISFRASTKLDGLQSVLGTEIDGDVHFYISYKNKAIYYSPNEGETWSQTSKNSKRNLIDIHPKKPNICFKGFVQLHISYDYGKTWNANKPDHTLGKNSQYYVWDLQHMKTYDKENDGNFTFTGYDFGSYYSNNLEDWSSWKSVNKGTPIMMSYDAASSELHNRVYSANQDRGSQSFLVDNTKKNSKAIETLREANTDNLRVTVSNGGKSVWYWYYYGAIGRAPVENGGNFRKVTLQRNLYDKWKATSMIPSPNENEDVIYIPWGKQLNKLEFKDNQIKKSLHPYKFPEIIESFGYSNINKNKWYIGLKSGIFMYSNDGGNSFKKSSYSDIWPKSENTHRKRRSVITTSPIDEATVFYAGKGNLFLISKDGGVTFTNHNKGLDVKRIVDMDASSDGKFVFAACEFGGAWVYAVKQDYWYKMDGKDVPSLVGFTDIQFIDNFNIARFATYGSGILDFKITGGIVKNKN